MAKRAGLSDEQLQALSTYAHSDAFDAKAKATLRYADHVTQGESSLAREVMDELKEHYQDDEIVELTLVICMANFTNRFNNALGNEPDIG